MSSRTHYTQLRLDPLPRESAEEMLAALLGDDQDLAPLKRLIIERTQGTPFFMEEMVQALYQEGVLQRNGVVRLTKPISTIKVPTTVQAVLASRIDRLAPPEKELLQTLAVLGRKFTMTLVERVLSCSSDQLEQMLYHLQLNEFLDEQPAVGDREYGFKHALTQEVAYNCVLIGRRRALHEQAGKAIESLFADRLDDHVTELAHHYSRTGNLNKAFEYLGRAGRQAIQRSAYEEGISNLRSAINLLAKLPQTREFLQQELDLQLTLGPAYFASDGWASAGAERAHARAWVLCQRIGDLAELFPALFGLWIIYLQHDELSKAYEIAEQLLQGAEIARDLTMLVYARLALGETAMWMGQLLRAKQHLEVALSFYDLERHRSLAYQYAGVDAGVMCRNYMAMTLGSLGYPEQALEQVKEASKLARELSHPNSIANAGFFSGSVRYLVGDARAAMEIAEQAIAAGYGGSEGLAVAAVLRGSAIVQQGYHYQGLVLIEEGLAARHTTAGLVGQPWGLCMLASALMEVGRFEEGLRSLAEALGIANDHEDRWCEAEVHRLNGELLLRQNVSETARAQNSFERAIEIARNQAAKLFELRATTGLARLLVKQGRCDEARTILAEIYNWFTEGFDTADLKDAKALLDELSD